MILRIASLPITLLAISGCAGLASSGTISSRSSSEATVCDMATIHRIESGFCVIDPSDLQIQPEDLHAGQQVRLITSASTIAEIKDGGSVETTEYVGTIDAIDANNIMLRDASLVTSAKVVRATPIVSRVPYLGRMFRNASVAQETHALPHGTTIPRSKVMAALGEGSEIRERIGVDFDFSSDTNESVLRNEVAFLIQEQSNQSTLSQVEARASR
ncbi:MAG: hypothetical protein KDB01_09565 [Planctomycetaceae bacterium]|nr:hypothetical protein [Planctomycetaceae bacterium]